MVFESGWGTSATVGGQPGYRFWLFPGSGVTVDWDKPLVIEVQAAASWQPNVTFDLAGATARVEYHEYTRDLQVVVRDALRAEAFAGQLKFTATGTGGAAPAAGSVTGGKAIEWESVLCSPDTTPCP
jgi:hypothetical protein